MRSFFFSWFILVFVVSCSMEQPSDTVLIEPQGTLSFWFQTTNHYWNGLTPEGAPRELVVIPGIGTLRLNVNRSMVSVNWGWDKRITGVDGINVQFPHLPGPARYHVALRWDSKNGRLNGFLNNTPWREIGTPLPPWTMPETWKTTVSTDASVSSLQVSDVCWPEEHIAVQCEQFPHPDVAAQIGYGTHSPMGDVEPLKGKLLYTVDLGSEAAMAGWRLEGPGILEREGPWLTMSSSEADTDGPAGHIVYWEPENFPASFIAQWDFQPISEYGLCIVFFATRGANGADLFDPGIKERAGIFTQYHSSDINCYHISYYANTPFNPGRITTNLRKNAGFHLVANGSPGVPAGSRDIHTVTLIKQDNHIRLGVDEKKIIDWTDDGQRYGPVHGAGKIGLRQMKWMQARYRDFKVWAMK